MNRLQELSRSWTSQDPSISRMRLTNEFRISRPVGGRDYSRFAGELAVQFSGLEGAVVYGNPDSMPILTEGRAETGELPLVTSRTLAQSADLKRLYGSADLRLALLKVTDDVESISRRISDVSYGLPEVIDVQPLMDSPVGSLIASQIEAPTLKRLSGEQGRVTQALGVRSQHSHLLYGALVIPWMFFPNGTPEEAVTEAHEYISRQELPQIVLDAAGYISMSAIAS